MGRRLSRCAVTRPKIHNQHAPQGPYADTRPPVRTASIGRGACVFRVHAGICICRRPALPEIVTKEDNQDSPLTIFVNEISQSPPYALLLLKNKTP
ncbi:hypothetical protein CD178_03043 (plasmid) [Komagataeibacter saccharivorans]|uniref:Uncharacterized protein n=1 Tax=Komagataeibacter saccharivorans TaxID=265959 RepID=A0A347WFZ4_9PROT|nr:hypothetical protein CD178_03043 [Komagataeibacter saccharivorans]